MADKQSYEMFRENRLIRRTFLVLFVAVVVGLFYIFRDYMWPFLFAITLYITLAPLHEKIFSKVKYRSLSATIIILALLLLILGPLVWILLTVGNQAYDLYLLIQDHISTGIIEEIHKNHGMRIVMKYFNLHETDVLAKLLAFVQRAAMDVFSSVTVIISFPISFIINFFFMVLMLFFFLKEGYRVDDRITRLLPFPRDIENEILSRMTEVVRVLMMGNLLIMLLQGLMVGLGFLFTGVPMALLWGSVAAILSLIPVVGTTFVWIPGALLLASMGKIGASVFLGIWCLFWYLFLENLVKPKVFGDRLRFHPLVFFFLLLGSIKTFNLPGVLAGPLLLTLFYSLLEIYRIMIHYPVQVEHDPGDVKSD